MVKKKKLQAPTSTSDEAPLFGGFPGVFLVVTRVVREPLAVVGLALVPLSPKTPVCICKRIAVLRI